VLRWPPWYAGADAALAALVLVLAFAAASFTARNSDVWLHLAAGKRLLAGEYTPGTDPFSYTGADRPWVNHSWLLDGAAYLLYGGTGQVLVVAKALVVALAFGLVLAIRRPNHALWPWAAVAGVAVLAAAPQFLLRPLVVSMLFLSVTLALLFRGAQKPNSWRVPFPVAIGVTFWFWANSDPWFFIGPLALALVLVGEQIQAALSGPEGDAVASEGEPLGRVPDAKALAKGLAVGVIACMLNPHHVRVWELPFELVGASGIEIDPRLKQAVLSPLNGDYASTPALGQNLNGLAYGVLMVAGAALLGFGRVRGSHAALWVGFAALSLVSVSAIPFFALVAVPLVAAQLNALGARAVLRAPGDPRSRLLLLGSSGGRVACVLGAVALCAAAYPGWVHPEAPPQYARRVAWAVEPEPSLAKAAQQFHQWREPGRLPAEVRGVIANTELANYVAWFAPEEKVFINTRYTFHRPELDGYLRLRRGLGLLVLPNERPDPAMATDVLAGAGAEYLAIHAGPGDPPLLRSRASEAANGLYRQWVEWSPWYVDGRTTVFGWHRAGTPVRPAFAGLRVDPLVLAFGPDVARVPDPELKQPFVQLGWEGAFVRPAKPTPVEAAEAVGWLRFYKEGPLRREQIREGVTGPLLLSFPGTTSFPWHRLAAQMAGAFGAYSPPPTDPDRDADTAARQAAPLLALRAARRAVAENPEHPDPYFVLAQVLGEPGLPLPLSDGERLLGRIAALRQCLARCPAPENYRRGQFTTSPADAAFQLAQLYTGRSWRMEDLETRKQKVKYIGGPLDVPPLGAFIGQAVFVDQKGGGGRLVRVPFPAAAQYQQSARQAQLVTGNTPFFLAIDAGEEMLRQALAYARIEFAGEAQDEFEAKLKSIEDLLKNVETAKVQLSDEYELTKGRGGLPGRVEMAIRCGLAGEALDLLSRSGADLEKEYKDKFLHGVMLRLSLEVALGRVEDANGNFNELDEQKSLEDFGKANLAVPFLELKYQAALQAGAYRRAGEVRVALEGRVIGLLDKMPPLDPLQAASLAARGADPAKVMATVLNAPFMPGAPILRPLVVHFWTDDWLGMNAALRQLVIGQLQQEAQFFNRRGVLALLAGDIAAARDLFSSAKRTAPPAWRLRAIQLQSAEMYLELINLAQHRAAR
jgi:hypothetical protein